MFVLLKTGTHILTYGASDEEERDFSEDVSDRRKDPCFHYTVLDQTWRATNTTTKMKMCDRNVKWKGHNSPSVNSHAFFINDGNTDDSFVNCDRLVSSLLQRKEFADA